MNFTLHLRGRYLQVTMSYAGERRRMLSVREAMSAMLRSEPASSLLLTAATSLSSRGLTLSAGEQLLAQVRRVAPDGETAACANDASAPPTR